MAIIDNNSASSIAPNSANNYCLILAGGKGRRLWPCSREHRPKQFVDFFGVGRTQLQQTYDRMAKTISPDHIYISTNAGYVDIVREQLPEVPREHILAEPIMRNTAPAMAWASFRIDRSNPDAVLIVVPTDMLIVGEDAFQRNVQAAMAFAAKTDTFVAIGVKPTRPEPGYGYIQTDGDMGDNIYRVRSFTEKPDREFAQVFVDSGEFVWNTGMFVSSVRNTIATFSRFLPEVLRRLYKQSADVTPKEEEEYMAEAFPLYPNLSIEKGVLEKLENVCVMKCDFGWGDLGTWHGIYEALPRSNDDNVVVDSDVFIENSHHNVIKLPKDKIGIISGLDDFIVAEKDNVLLICKKSDSSALVRKYVNEIQLKKGDEFI